MFQKYYKLILFFFIALSSQTASSADLYSLLASSYVVTLSGGPAWESSGTTQTLNLAPEIEKTYTANKPTSTFAEGEVFLGIQRPLPKALQGQIGLAIAVTGDATLSGDIWDDADPIFDNYTYQYKVNHTHVALKGKLLGDWDWPLMPWVSGSIGIGFNRAYDFNNTPTIYEAIPNSNFSSYTTTAFTYTVGIGFQRKLTKNWQMGVGYEFADWGKNQLGTADGQTTGDVLSLSHLYTNSLLLNLTYTA